MPFCKKKLQVKQKKEILRKKPLTIMSISYFENQANMELKRL